MSPNLRRRTQRDQSRQDSSSETTIVSTESQSSRSLRFYLVWTARILLPIVFLLSKAKLVVIEKSSSCQPNHNPTSIASSTAVIVFAHSRPEYLSRTLQSIRASHPGGYIWPIIVSKDQQDGTHDDVSAVTKSFLSNASTHEIAFYDWSHAKNYDEPETQSELFVDDVAYRRISRHYFWALSRIFSEGLPDTPPIERVIILEDDMEIAADFFAYFEALAPMLEIDPTLFCISAWNDNGFEHLVRDHRQLHRTDFFPGLGWMLTRNIWEELSPKWPEKYWDDWMRNTDQTKGRQCIRPEISRTRNFGEKGVSQSFHYKSHISKVIIAKEAVEFNKLNLTYLEPEKYYHMIFSRLAKAVQLKYSNYLTSRPQDKDVVAFYPEEHLEPIGKRTGIMTDHRNGIRRTSYKDVIFFPWNENWAFVVKRGWQPPEGYQLEGSTCC